MGRRGIVDSAGDGDFFGGDGEIESRRAEFAAVAARKKRADMRLVGRFIGAETDVAIDAEDGFFRLGEIFGREFREIGVDRFDQLEAWAL